MILDCAVIGGGPAGMNASLVLGRSRRKTILFDDNQPRNAVTNESHGFLTRDGITPSEFRRLGQEDLKKYPDVTIKKQRVTEVHKVQQLFTMQTEAGEVYRSKKLILATGLKETLPNVKQMQQFYGTSIFSCPFCDGWELRDRRLAIIADNTHAFHMAKVAFNWSKDLILCTNGNYILSSEQQDLLEKKGIHVYVESITSLVGENGYLEKIIFADGTEILRDGGFVVPEMKQASSIGESLGCELNEQGGIITDRIGRTNVDGVFASGDMAIAGPAQLVIAASEGHKAAIGVNAAFIEEDF
ncbi:NAD(P)/FAD-dependent oxidoreductase [Virgibacillus salexigens]|uniref:NAD(P)/FAD-dependent oxidoreductase n=1 Tax=Virgibacillus salexigens TaxID=61016 RepID=UPI00190C321D|nr:NAD(P)/FAD-dependent oxidoreductase [Virgibacillus salexigens]